MLSAGNSLGPYQVLSPLGAGGMGEVYRARDGRLGREVAIKVLPPSFAKDEDRLRRFEQEARAAGALSHPNLLSVFDVGSHEGSPYLVSELLEGSTLRTLLAGAGLPQRKALDLSAQIARGLAAAHDKGIVHRDLKPDNVFVTTDGRVKILDFGLARMTRPFEMGEDDETVSSPTSPGTVLGTVGYMSPEQVQGLPADQRSDTFSFGAVLYEMLAGRRAFKGATSVETMNAILKEDPPDISGETPLPPALDRVVRRCLEKNADERFRSIQDVAFALEALSGASGKAPVSGSARPSKRRWLLAAVALLGAAAMGLSIWALKGIRPKEPPSYQRLTFRRGTVEAARFTPDGQTILYAAGWDGGPTEVFTTRADSTESRSLDLGSAQLLGVSSTGELAVGLRWERRQFVGRGTLARLSLAGGAPRELAEGVSLADWAPDGKSLAVSIMESDGTRIEFPLGKAVHHERGIVPGLRVSPRGERVAFVSQWDPEVSIRVMDAAGQATTLSSGWNRITNLAWSGTGEEVWFTAARAGSAYALHAVNLAGRERLVARMPGTLTLQDVSADGRVLLAHGTTRREVVSFTRGATGERDFSWLDYSWPLSLSPDGGFLLFNVMGQRPGELTDLYLRRTDGSSPVRLGSGYNMSSLSPDGRFVLAEDPRPGFPLLSLIPTGAGQARPLPPFAVTDIALLAWFPDARHVLVAGLAADRRRLSFILDIEGGPPRPVLAEGVTPHLVSPDGKRVLATEPNGKLSLVPLDGGPARAVAENVTGEPVGWSSDGRSVYLAEFGVPGRFLRLHLATGKSEPWREVMPADAAGIQSLIPRAITPDGESYVYTYRRLLSDLYLVQGLE